MKSAKKRANQSSNNSYRDIATLVSTISIAAGSLYQLLYILQLLSSFTLQVFYQALTIELISSFLKYCLIRRVDRSSCFHISSRKQEDPLPYPMTVCEIQ